MVWNFWNSQWDLSDLQISASQADAFSVDLHRLAPHNDTRRFDFDAARGHRVNWCHIQSALKFRYGILMASIVGNLRAHTFITKCCLHHLHQIIEIDLKLQSQGLWWWQSSRRSLWGLIWPQMEGCGHQSSFPLLGKWQVKIWSAAWWMATMLGIQKMKRA